MAKILVIEDDKLLVKVYKKVLEVGKHLVTTTTKGQEGLLEILNGGYDLILLDILLPQKSGIDILKEIQAIKPKTANGPIIVLSNVDKEAVIKQAMDLGASGYILKDKIDPKGVLKEVNNYLSQAKQGLI